MARNVTVPSPAMGIRFPAGSVLGHRYRIDDVIAEGGMGTVYRGWHVILERLIAIKVVGPECARNPLAVSRFLNEARALAQLHGSHVVRVLDTGYVQGGTPYMVLEYLEGRDLRAVLDEDGPLSLARSVDYLLQVCEALAEAHGLGLVHCDLKPENLFLTRLRDHTEVIKVIDFGISRHIDADRRDTLQHQSAGSPDYMAPEQIAPPHRVDARTDIWTLGVVLFELLTGTMPFASHSIPNVYHRVLYQEPTSLRRLRGELPRELEDVLRRCLRKPAEERFANVQELAQALAPFASDTGLDSIRQVRRIPGTFAAQSEESLCIDVSWVEEPDSEASHRPFELCRAAASTAAQGS